MMMGYGFGGLFAWLGVGLGILVHLAFTALVIMAVVWLFKALFRNGSPNEPRNDAFEIVRQRYAKGEITIDEYQHMKKELA
jgi:putative membrane protein